MMIEAWKPVWAGGQIHVWELCKRLTQNHNCEIDLFVMNLKDNDALLPGHEAHFENKLNIFRVGKPCNFDFKSRLLWCKEVIKQVEMNNNSNVKKYDLIHVHANLPGWPAKKLSKKLKIPMIFTVHGCGLQAIKDMYGVGVKSFMLYKFEKYLQTKIKYDCEISVDSSFLKYKNVNKTIVVIPNGVDIEAFDAVNVEKSKKFKIIWVGRLHPQKGITYLLDALALIKEEDSTALNDVEVHLIGSGELEQELKEKSSKLGLNETVKFRGKIYGADLIKEYQSSHLFVLPSLYEGQPLTLLEAWAAKLPVIVTDVGGNRDFVVEGENGFIIPPKNSQILSRTILNNLKNKKLVLMGELGHKLVKEDYTWDKMTEKTFEKYIKEID